MDEKKETMVEVNGTPMTLEEFQEKKKEVENSKGMSLVEVGPNKFRIRIQE